MIDEVDSATNNQVFLDFLAQLRAYYIDRDVQPSFQSVILAGVYNFYEPSINVATMFGFVKNQNGMLAVSNRIFETWLYNLYLSAADMQRKEIYTASLQDKKGADRSCGIVL